MELNRTISEIKKNLLERLNSSFQAKEYLNLNFSQSPCAHQQINDQQNTNHRTLEPESAFKKEEILVRASTWIDAENAMLCEESQMKKAI